MNSTPGFEPQARHVFKMDKQAPPGLGVSMPTETVTTRCGTHQASVSLKLFFLPIYCPGHFLIGSGDIFLILLIVLSKKWRVVIILKRRKKGVVMVSSRRGSWSPNRPDLMCLSFTLTSLLSSD